MEHLPRPKSQERTVFDSIPYLCKDRYDGGSFLEYPQRLCLPRLEIAGFHPGQLSVANQHFLRAMPPAELESFCQSWLFFGLLREFLGDLYRYDDFVTTISEGYDAKIVVTTAKLIPRLEQWETRIKQEDIHERGSGYGHLANCLCLCFAVLIIKYPVFDNLLKFHLLSVAETLGYAANKAFGVAWTEDAFRSLVPRVWGDAIDEDFRGALLLGWSNCCPSQMQVLADKFSSPQALGFVASCFREDDTGLRHDSCDKANCRAADMMSFRRLPRHVNNHCACELLFVNEDLLAQCLSKGCLPLIRIVEDKDLNTISIDVVASTDSTAYVALSHVWADGLGNPGANALPRCQLSKLKNLINNLDKNAFSGKFSSYGSKILLWCDTLCCPATYEESKNLALGQMYRTYDDASIVLVIDNGLMSHTVSDMDLYEASLRVALSRWVRRLWTLQEGALPASKHRLWFQFKDAAMQSRTLYAHLKKAFETNIQWRGVAISLMGRFHSYTSLFSQIPGYGRPQLETIMSGLQYRSVTVPSDEPILIATLLGLDLKEILETSQFQRMNKLWHLIASSPHGVPKDILFHVGPKLQEPGLKWAPPSLLFQDNNLAFPIPGDARDRGFLGATNQKGLLVELAGLRINIARSAKGLPPHLTRLDQLPQNERNTLLMTDRQGLWYVVCRRLPAAFDSFLTTEDLCAIVPKLSKPWILYHESRVPRLNGLEAHHDLLVEAEQGQELQDSGATSVEMKLHVNFSRLTAPNEPLAQAAHSLLQQVASSAAARHLAEFETRNSIDLNDPVYKEALDAVDLELEQASRSQAAMEALAAGGNSVDEEGFNRFNAYLVRIFRGVYLQIEEYAPRTEKWCVD